MRTDRICKMKEIMQCAYDIIDNPAVQRQCPEIIMRANYLLERGVIVTPKTFWWKREVHLKERGPLSPSRFKLQKEENDKRVGIFPLLKRDVSLSREMNWLVNATDFAAYAAENHYISLSLDSCETRRFMAAALLHEAGHAQAAEKDGRALKGLNRNLPDRLMEELEMWIVDCKLALALGGKPYHEEVSKTVAQFHDLWEGGKTIQSTQGIGWPLDFCYEAPPKEAYARLNRDRTYTVFCSLIASETYLKSESDIISHKFRIIQIMMQPRYDEQEKLMLSFMD